MTTRTIILVLAAALVSSALTTLLSNWSAADAHVADITPTDDVEVIAERLDALERRLEERRPTRRREAPAPVHHVADDGAASRRGPGRTTEREIDLPEAASTEQSKADVAKRAAEVQQTSEPMQRGPTRSPPTTWVG